MAKRLLYIQDDAGRRKWAAPAFNDDAHKAEDYLYLCMHSDGHLTELDLIKLPRVHIPEFIEALKAVANGEGE